jgi:hypothetical protein
MKYTKELVLACALASLPMASNAVELMPDFANIPTGWVTDRYEPASFSNVGPFQGRTDVLGISIDSTGDLANRPPAFQSSFYNTQGRQHAVSGGAGSTLSADLWIPRTWGNAANGNVRTDMWGVTSGGGPDYPIIGFSNFGTGARFRVWDANTVNGWVDLATTINYEAWNTLSLEYTGASYVFSINGSVVYTDLTTVGTGLGAVIMQAFNFADPAVSTAATVPYTAFWDNVVGASVPDAGSTLAMFGLAMAGLAGFSSRKRS